MITVDGVEYGHAAEVAARLGPDVTPAMVRAWGRRGRLDRHVDTQGGVWFRLDQAATAERDARQAARGRPRAGRLDTTPPAARSFVHSSQ